MDKLVKKYIVAKAISHYGEEHQIDKAIEELLEMVAELENYKKGIVDRHNLITEMVDVKIMMKQVKSICNISYIELEHEEEFKYNRLRKRISEAEKKGVVIEC